MTPEQRAKTVVGTYWMDLSHGERLIAAAIRAAVEAEREACAKVADDLVSNVGYFENDIEESYVSGRINGALEIRENIRARKELSQ